MRDVEQFFFFFFRISKLEGNCSTNIYSLFFFEIYLFIINFALREYKEGHECWFLLITKRGLFICQQPVALTLLFEMTVWLIPSPIIIS